MERGEGRKGGREGGREVKYSVNYFLKVNGERAQTLWDNRPWAEWCNPLSIKLKLLLTEAAVKVGTTCSCT